MPGAASASADEVLRVGTWNCEGLKDDVHASGQKRQCVETKLKWLLKDSGYEFDIICLQEHRCDDEDSVRALITEAAKHRYTAFVEPAITTFGPGRGGLKAPTAGAAVLVSRRVFESALSMEPLRPGMLPGGPGCLQGLFLRLDIQFPARADGLHPQPLDGLGWVSVASVCLGATPVAAPNAVGGGAAGSTAGGGGAADAHAAHGVAPSMLVPPPGSADGGAERRWREGDELLERLLRDPSLLIRGAEYGAQAKPLKGAARGAAAPAPPRMPATAAVFVCGDFDVALAPGRDAPEGPARAAQLRAPFTGRRLRLASVLQRYGLARAPPEQEIFHSGRAAPRATLTGGGTQDYVFFPAASALVRAGLEFQRLHINPPGCVIDRPGAGGSSAAGVAAGGAVGHAPPKRFTPHSAHAVVWAQFGRTRPGASPRTYEVISPAKLEAGEMMAASHPRPATAGAASLRPGPLGPGPYALASYPLKALPAPSHLLADAATHLAARILTSTGLARAVSEALHLRPRSREAAAARLTSALAAALRDIAAAEGGSGAPMGPAAAAAASASTAAVAAAQAAAAAAEAAVAATAAAIAEQMHYATLSAHAGLYPASAAAMAAAPPETPSYTETPDADSAAGGSGPAGPYAWDQSPGGEQAFAASLAMADSVPPPPPPSMRASPGGDWFGAGPDPVETLVSFLGSSGGVPVLPAGRASPGSGGGGGGGGARAYEPATRAADGSSVEYVQGYVGYSAFKSGYRPGPTAGGPAMSTPLPVPPPPGPPKGPARALAFTPGGHVE